MARQAEIFKNQTFRVAAPTAQKVLLAGDFTDWRQKAIPMHKGSDGAWTAAVKLPPGSHSYLFIVDGEWRDDPDCPLQVPNPFGGHNSVRQVA